MSVMGHPTFSRGKSEKMVLALIYSSMINPGGRQPNTNTPVR